MQGGELLAWRALAGDELLGAVLYLVQEAEVTTGDKMTPSVGRIPLWSGLERRRGWMLLKHQGGVPLVPVPSVPPCVPLDGSKIAGDGVIQECFHRGYHVW